MYDNGADAYMPGSNSSTKVFVLSDPACVTGALFVLVVDNGDVTVVAVPLLYNSIYSYIL